MRKESGTCSRVLIIDDNPAIHGDFRKILAPPRESATALLTAEAALFGEETPPEVPLALEIDSAFQGQEGLASVRRAKQEGRPYALAFVDARMPPGWDGIETVVKIWEQDPDVQIVICTAYSDYTWQDIRRKLVHADRLVILNKPFDAIEILQLTDALTQKWRLAREDKRHQHGLEELIRERNRDLEAMRSIDAQLSAVGGRSNAQHPGKTADPKAQRLQTLELALRRALAADQLTVHYQPLVDIASRRVVSMEALLRWQHPTLGAISPGEFIPIAEESGLIVPIGEFVLRTVCEQSLRWQREGVAVVPVAVNISAMQLESGGLWDVVREVLRDTGLPPHRLALELTESSFIQNAPRHVHALQELRANGVRVQIDDFGTGYSSLSYLKHLPVDTLKIDRSFITQLATSSVDEAIVSAILALSRTLGLRTVAEGVETPEQLEVLGRHGCEFAQGFYFCRPIPAVECKDLLIDLAERSSFTDTLRIQVNRKSHRAKVDAAVTAAAVGNIR